MLRGSARPDASSPLAAKSGRLTSEFDLKNYPHFDAPLPIREIRALVANSDRVAANSFYPFFRYMEKWQPYRDKGATKPKPKEREIRYASRRDAYIFSHYRKILSAKYEEELLRRGIASCPIAYRKIPKVGSTGGKCNIDFALDAIKTIERIGNCVAIALDIEKFFENLDHARIKSLWQMLLGRSSLPPDHYAVFKNITRYHFVDHREAMKRLGYFGPVERHGHKFDAFRGPYKDVPKQLCSPSDFREKICGGDPSLPSLVMVNDSPFGIPQGAPISDLIANLYLIDFDEAVNRFSLERGGVYMRYSDDILLILPDTPGIVEDSIGFVGAEIAKSGSRVRIKDAKTCIVRFARSQNSLMFTHLSGPQGMNGFEYLGFRFDGRNVYIRDSTISRLYRKVSVAARAEAMRHIQKNPMKNQEELLRMFNYSWFMQKFGRVNKLMFSEEYRTWTFHTYVRRAEEIFGDRGLKFSGQVRNLRSIAEARVSAVISDAMSKRAPSGDP